MPTFCVGCHVVTKLGQDVTFATFTEMLFLLQWQNKVANLRNYTNPTQSILIHWGSESCFSTIAAVN